MRFYRQRVYDYWLSQPFDKLRLAPVTLGMFWDPWASVAKLRPEDPLLLRVGRVWVYPVFMLIVYGLAVGGPFLLPRGFVALAVLLLGYQTFLAAAFVGTTRYRVPWDFLIAILAAGALSWIYSNTRAAGRT